MSRLPIILLAFLACPAVSQPLSVPRLPYASLAGPRNLCTEFFSVRLETGETLAWLPAQNFTGGISYVLISGRRVLQVGPWQGPRPPQRSRQFRHPFSPVSERSASDLRRLPNLRGPDGRHVGPDYRISYRLHGSQRQAAPLSVSWFTSHRAEEMPIVYRIRPGTMEARNCRVSARLDPALAGEIGQAWPY